MFEHLDFRSLMLSLRISFGLAAAFGMPALAKSAGLASEQPLPLGRAITVSQPNACVDKTRLVAEILNIRLNRSVDARLKIVVTETQRTLKLDISLADRLVVDRLFENAPTDCSSRHEILAVAIAVALDDLFPPPAIQPEKPIDSPQNLPEELPSEPASTPDAPEATSPAATEVASDPPVPNAVRPAKSPYIKDRAALESRLVQDHKIEVVDQSSIGKQRSPAATHGSRDLQLRISAGTGISSQQHSNLSILLASRLELRAGRIAYEGRVHAGLAPKQNLRANSVSGLALQIELGACFVAPSPSKSLAKRVGWLVCLGAQSGAVIAKGNSFVVNQRTPWLPTFAVVPATQLGIAISRRLSFDLRAEAGVAIIRPRYTLADSPESQRIEVWRAPPVYVAGLSTLTWRIR